MKQLLFLRYSDYDRDKVSVLDNELKGNILLEPIIIAESREALKPLVTKVTVSTPSH